MKKKPTGTISAKTLQGKIKATRAEVQATDDQLYMLHEKREHLQVKLDTFIDLLRDVRPDDVETSPAPSRSLTEAAVDFLVAHPGVRPVDIVNALVDTMSSTAKNPRKNLHQTILNLKNRGRIEEAPDGGLRVAGNGTAPHR